jgi:exopolysaccharide production protein ExoZ
MLPNVQLLRAVAAYLVVFVHVSELLPKTPVTSFLHDKGYSGVDLFFVISGFIMVYTTSDKAISAGQFLLNRIRRIIPLYYSITFLVFGIAATLPFIFRSTSPDFHSLINSLAFLPFEKTPGRIYPFYYLGWTLNYEMFFYLIFALSLFLWYRMRVILCATIIIGLVLSPINSNGPGYIAIYFYSRPIMLDFCLGMIIATFRSQILTAMCRIPVLPWLTLFLGVTGLLLASSLFPSAPSLYDPPTNTFVTFGLPAALIVLAAIGFNDVRTRGQPWQFLQDIGNASYSIYLSHFFIIGGLTVFADRLGLSSTQRILIALMTIPLTAIVGIFLYRFFERPAGKILTQWTSFKSAI